MKKLISILLLLAMCLSLFAGCKKDEDSGSTEPTGQTSGASQLDSAIAYLRNMYQTAGKDEAMEISSNKEVLSKVTIAGVSYPVTWTVKVTQGEPDVASVSTEDGRTLLVIKKSTTDATFTATATVTDADGNTASIDFNYIIPAGYMGTDQASMEEIVKMAYELAEGESLDKPATLTGVITRIKSPWDDGYQNITVIIQVGDLTDMLIECYRMKGDGADGLAIGDTITVTGTLKNYSGTIEFDAGCIVEQIVKSTEPAPEAPADMTAIVDEAYGLVEGGALPYSATLTGVVTTVNTPYSSQYGNVTVTIAVEGREDKPIMCYRMKGDGAETVKVSDTITVTGYLINYGGTIEFEQGCTLDALVPGDQETPVAPSDMTQIVKDAYALAEDEALPYIATLTGKISSIDTPYDSGYQNITVTIKVSGIESKPIMCYRLKGTGADALAVGDTITVTGYIKNYKGTVEFDAGCTLDKVVSGGGTTQTAPSDPKAIVDAAYGLAEGESLPYYATLTGVISTVDDAYSTDYNNITVTIKVSGRESKPIMCFRLKGEGVESLAVGDTITVKGILKNHYGTVEFDAGCTLEAVTSGGGAPVTQLTKPADIVNFAYGLADGEEMSYDVTLTGKITSIKTAYSSTYDNISVVIAVNGASADKPILCYRLKGDGAKTLSVGAEITVTGRLKNYGGTIEFDSGCSLDKIVSAGTAVPTDPAVIVSAAFALAEGESLPYSCKLTGKIVSIDTPYDDGYKNVTVTIEVEGKNIMCYRLKGDNAANLAVGDTITVSGIIKNYKGTVEFDAGCELV